VTTIRNINPSTAFRVLWLSKAIVSAPIVKQKVCCDYTNASDDGSRADARALV
jgi:hypothetical protein